MAEISCPDCGAAVTDTPGPVHPYISAVTGCWAAYCSLADWTSSLSGQGAATTAQHLVDAYAAQHPGNPARRNRQSVAVHLMSLCASLEHGIAGSRRRAMMGGWTHREYPLLCPRPAAFPVTVLDVTRASADARCGMVTALAEATWAAWSRHHDQVRSWLARAQQWK